MRAAPLSFDLLPGSRAYGGAGVGLGLGGEVQDREVAFGDEERRGTSTIGIHGIKGLGVDGNGCCAALMWPDVRIT